MNITSILFRLACVAIVPGISMATTLPAKAPASDQARPATPAACYAGKYKPGDVPAIQADLGRIYGKDAEYLEDAGGDDPPLRDGRMGVITRKWIGKFCAGYHFEAKPSSFEATVVRELARVAAGGITKAGMPAPVQAAPPPPPPAPLESFYAYDPKVLVKPRNEALILPRLRTIKERYYDHAQFMTVLQRALADIDVDADTMLMIETGATVDGYLLTLETLAELGNKGASQALIEKLSPIVGDVYDDSDAFNEALHIAVGEGKEKSELMQLSAKLFDMARIRNYRIPDTIEADFASKAELPAPVAALFTSMADVKYPSLELLESALAWRVQQGLGMCAFNRFRQEGRLDDKQFLALKTIFPADAQLFDEIAELRKLVVPCKPAQQIEAKVLAFKADSLVTARLARSVRLQHAAKMATSAKGQLGPTAIDSCGCSPGPQDGVIYGFYPLWTDAEKKPKVNFGFMSRVGLYGVTFSDRGDLVNPPDYKGPPARLIDAAHVHRTKVDWVVHKNDWRSWAASDAEGKKRTLETLIDSIEQRLATPLFATDWRGTAIASLGLERAPTLGDGVTLRFDRFPKQDQALFDRFVVDLYARLKAMKPARQLNLLVDHAAMVGEDASTFSIRNLLDLIAKTNKIDEDQSFANSTIRRADDIQVLVLVREPTADSKRVLREEIESALHSSARVRMLRDVVPVLEYDGVHVNQLRDDLIYNNDNFGGIGFWPIPFATDDDTAQGSTTANSVLQAYFDYADNDHGRLEKFVDWVCPNRGWLRWIAWVSALAAIVVAVVYARCRGCGTRLDDNPLYLVPMGLIIMLPFVAVFTLIIGDPILRSDSGVHLFFAFVVLCVVVLPALYLLFKPARKLP